MGLTIKQDAETAKGAFEFQINAEVQEVRLLDCAASAPWPRAESEEELGLTFGIETEILDAPPDEAWFAVGVKVLGEPTGTDAETARRLFEFNARYGLHYTLRPGFRPSAEALNAFKEGNAVFHAWPYFRELLQSVTLRMGILIPALPLLRLAPKAQPKRAGGGRKPKPELASRGQD
jgi:hypothetical protein